MSLCTRSNDTSSAVQWPDMAFLYSLEPALIPPPMNRQVCYVVMANGLNLFPWRGGKMCRMEYDDSLSTKKADAEAEHAAANKFEIHTQN